MTDRIPAIFLMFALAISFVGCSPATAPNTKATTTKTPPRTIQMDDASLFVNRDDWIYTYPVDDGNCHIIGHNVEFLERKPEKLVVKLDSNIELNVPISDKNFLVDSAGFHDIKIDLDEILVNADMIKTVVEASN